MPMSLKRTRGFTLIELMITVVIVGILAAIAVPSYSQYQIRSNRAAAESLMLDLANREQQYLLDKRAYNCASTAVADLLGATPIPDKVSAHYTVTIPAGTCSATAFIINAVPKAGTIQANDQTLTLDQAGVKSPVAKW
jgi:type IV pilus assembly protein PilE